MKRFLLHAAVVMYFLSLLGIAYGIAQHHWPVGALFLIIIPALVCALLTDLDAGEK